ncbi:MAG: hypothetical protein AAFX78_09670 [Cyanobacteria bacterium J06638_20]
MIKHAGQHRVPIEQALNRQDYRKSHFILTEFVDGIGAMSPTTSKRHKP